MRNGLLALSFGAFVSADVKFQTSKCWKMPIDEHSMDGSSATHSAGFDSGVTVVTAKR